jgi:hypothetical protein
MVEQLWVLQVTLQGLKVSEKTRVWFIKKGLQTFQFHSDPFQILSDESQLPESVWEGKEG